MGNGLLVIHYIHWDVINKASLMIDCGEMPTGIRSLGCQMAIVLQPSDKDCSMGWILSVH